VIAKNVRATMASKMRDSPESTFRLVCMGDKSVQLLVRDQAQKIAFSFGDLSKKPFNFAGASIICEKIMEGDNFDNVTLVWNKFVSAISYIQDRRDISSGEALLAQQDLSEYEFEEDQRLFHVRDLVEFQLANTLYHAFCQGVASELGARMSAMDSASRNASDMLKRLNISYNRGRQAAITTELTEIISGAAAVSG